MQPKVSIIIPCYNSARTLPDALSSVLAQTYRNIEVIVVDDGSTDATRAVLEPYIASGSVTCLQQGNKGCGAARNAGVARASGELVAFLDADDSWEPEKLARQVAGFSEDPNSIVSYTDRLLLDPEGNPTGGSYAGRPGFRGSARMLPRLAFANMLTLSSAVVRTAAFRNSGGFTERYELMMFADYDLWLKLAPLGRFRRVPEALTRYRTKAPPTAAEKRSNHAKIAAVFLQRLRAASLSTAPWYALGWCIHSLYVL